MLYTPLSGLYYNWSDGYQESDYVNYYKSYRFYVWGGYSYSFSYLRDHQNDYTPTSSSSGGSDLLPGTYIGQTAGAAGEYTIFYKNDVSYHKEWDDRWVTYDDWTHFSGYEKYKWGEKTGKVVSFQHSLKAYNPIQVRFIGSTTGGSINMEANKNILLGGDITGVANGITGTSITIRSNDGSINQQSGMITGDDVTLLADQGIGNNGMINHRAIGDNATIEARTMDGDLNFSSFASIGKQGNIALIALSTNGNTSVTTDGSIYQVGTNATVAGERIDIESRHGSIGQFGNSLIIDAGQTPVNSADTMSASINAKAQGDIYLTQKSGDMRIGEIDASNGNVMLQATNGNFLNVLPASETSAESKNDSLIARWIELGIINEDGSTTETQVKNTAIDNFENGVRTEFDNYISQRDSYADHPELEKSDAYLDLEAKYSAFADADAYLTAQAADAESDYYKLSHDTYGWSKDQLLYAIQKSIINQTSGSSQTIERPANIKGRNITLTALNGGIGKDEAAEEISLVGLGSNLDALKKLSAAEASDVTWDEDANKATIGHTTPIGIQMTDPNGSLNATANSNIYIAATTDDPIYINNIDASTSNIRVLGRDGVYNVSLIPSAINLKGKDVIIEGGDGSIGTVDKPIFTDASGKFTARAEGLINIFQNSLNTMNVSAIYSGADVTLHTLVNLFSVNTGIQSEDLGYINAGGNLTLTSDAGSIGETGKGLRILVDNTDLVQATALLGDINLDGQVKSSSLPAFTAGKLTAGPAGKVAVHHVGSDLNLTDTVTGTTGVSLTGKTINQNTPDSYIITGSLSGTAADGVNLNHDNNQILQAQLTNTNSGDIIFETITALILNGISNFAADGKVTVNSPLAIASLQNIISKGEIIINAGTSFNAVGTISSDKNLDITSTNGFLIANDLVGDNITLTSSDLLTFNKANADNDLTVLANGLITHLSTIIAGNNVTINTTVGDIIMNTLTLDGNLSVEAPGQIVFNNASADGYVNVTGSGITAGNMHSGIDLNLDADNGLISAVTLSSDHDMNLTSDTQDILVTSAQGNNINITANNGNAVIGQTISTLDTIISAKSVQLLDGTAGNNIELSALESGANVGNLNADNNVTIDAATSINAGNVVADNDISMTAANGNTNSLILDAGNDIDVSTTDFMTNEIIAGHDINTNANGSIIALISRAGNDLNLESVTGSIQALITFAGNYMTLIADGSVDNIIAASGNAITMVSRNGDLTTIIANANAEVNLHANNGDLTAGSVLSSDNISLSAQNMDVLSAIAPGNVSIDIFGEQGTLVNVEAGQSLTLNANNAQVVTGVMIAANDVVANAGEMMIGTVFGLGIHSEDLNTSSINDLINEFSTDDLDELSSQIGTMIETVQQNAFSGFNIDSSFTDFDPDFVGSPKELVVNTINAALFNVFYGNLYDPVLEAKILDGELVGNGVFSVTANDGDLFIGNGMGAGSIDLKADNGTLSVGTLITGKDANVSAYNLDIMFVDALRDANLNAVGIIQDTNITAGRDINVSTDGNIERVITVAGNNSQFVSNNGSITSIDAATGNNLLISASGDVISNGLSAGNNISIDGANIYTDLTVAGNDLSVTATGNTVNTSSTALHDIIVNANGDVSNTALVAGNDISVNAGGNFTSHAIEAGSNLAVDAGGSITGFETEAGNSIAMSAGDDYSSTYVSALNGNLELTAGGNISSFIAEAGNDVNMTSGGNVSISTTYSGNDFNVNAAGNIISENSFAHNNLSMTAGENITSGDARAEDGNLSFVARSIDSNIAGAYLSLDMVVTEYLNTTTLFSGSGITLNAGTSIVSGNANTGGKIEFDAGTSIDSTHAQANSDISFSSGGSLVSTFAQTNGNLNIEATGDINADESLATNDISFISRAGINAISTDAGNDINIAAANGDITITDAAAINNLSLTANNGDVSLTSGRTQNGNATLNADNGSVTISNKLDVAGTSNIEATSQITALNISSGDKATVTAHNGLIDIENINTTNSGADIEITTVTSGNIELTNADAARDLIINAADDLAVENSESGGNTSIGASGNADIQTAKTGGNLSVDATNINITSADAGIDLNLNAANTVNSDVLAAGRNISIEGNSIIINSTTAGNNVELAATLDINSTTMQAGNDISMNAETVNTNQLIAGNDISIHATSFTANNTKADNDISINATTVTGNSTEAGNDIKITADAIDAENTVSGNDITLNSNSYINTTTTNAGHNLNMTAAGDINSINAQAGSDINIYTTGDIFSEEANAGHDINITADGNIKNNDAAAGNDINMSAGADIACNNAEAGKNINFTAGNIITSANANAEGSISINAANFSRTDVLTAGRDITIDATEIVVTRIIAGNDISVTAAGNVSLADSKSGNNTLIAAGGNVDLLFAKAGGSIAVDANQIKISNADAINDISFAADTIKTITTTAGSNLNMTGNTVISDVAKAGNSLSINADSATIFSAGARSIAVDANRIDIQQADAVNDISFTAAGNINSANVNAGRNLCIKSKYGEIKAESIQAKNDACIAAANGKINIANLTSGNHVSVTAENGPVNIKHVESGKNLEVAAKNGDVNLTEAIAGNDFLVKVESGDIYLDYATSKTGNSTINTNGGTFTIKKALEIGGDYLYLINKGDLILDSFSLIKNLSIVNTGGDVIIGELLSTQGGISLETIKNGNIELGNVTSEKDIHLETDAGNITSEGRFESRQGNVNLIAGGEGHINVHELLARKDIKGLTENGDIMLAKINGKNVTLIVNHENNRVEIDEAKVESSLSVTANTIDLNTVDQTDNSDFLKMYFNGVNNGPMDELLIEKISSDMGVQLKGLWTDHAEIHSESEYFRLENVYAIDKALISNKSLTMSVYGRNPIMDGSDIVIYFVPTGNTHFTNISFQNEYAGNGGESYVLVYCAEGIDNVSDQFTQLEEIAATEQSDGKKLDGTNKITTFVKITVPTINDIFSFGSSPLVSINENQNPGGVISLQNNQIVYLRTGTETEIPDSGPNAGGNNPSMEDLDSGTQDRGRQNGQGNNGSNNNENDDEENDEEQTDDA